MRPNCIWTEPKCRRDLDPVLPRGDTERMAQRTCYAQPSRIRVQRPLSAKDRDLDTVSLERRNDGRIVNRVGVAFEQLQGRKSEQRPEIRKIDRRGSRSRAARDLKRAARAGDHHVRIRGRLSNVAPRMGLIPQLMRADVSQAVAH
jgi:hypothetical protein